MSHKIDMVGRRFGRLVVIKEVDPHIKPSGQKITMYKCICDCGNYKTVSGTHLRSGHHQSCGCLKKEQEKHGNTRLARIWLDMIARCYNEKSTSYKNYGAKGITVCESWKNDFEIFKSWAEKSGYTNNLTIDRIDNTKGYEPINCRWATPKQQANNRKNNLILSYKDEAHTAAEWADILNVNVKRIYEKKSRGLSDTEVLKQMQE